jgi:DNA-binding response OmpR family regulator
MDNPLAGRSVLIVEDDIILATDLAAFLKDAGCKVILPTTSVSSAISAIAHYVFDAAILDVNIRNEWVFPVGHALDKAAIPVLFLTAYARQSIPAEYRDRPFIQKPYAARELRQALIQLFAETRGQVEPPKIATPSA